MSHALATVLRDGRRPSAIRNSHPLARSGELRQFTVECLSPLRGFFSLFVSESWGSRPRLNICRRFAAPRP